MTPTSESTRRCAWAELAVPRRTSAHASSLAFVRSQWWTGHSSDDARAIPGQPTGRRARARLSRTCDATKARCEDARRRTVVTGTRVLGKGLGFASDRHDRRQPRAGYDATRRVAKSVRPAVVATVSRASERDVSAVASSTTASWLGVGPQVPIGCVRPLRSVT